MRKLSIALLAILLIAAGGIWAQKIATQKLATAPGKHVGHNAPPRGHSQNTRNGRHSLDNLYNSTDVPIPIPDLGFITSTLTISDNTTITDLNVHIGIQHPYMRDLHAILYGPDTSIHITLFSLLPIDSAENMDGWFDDGAAVSIADVDTPWIPTGTWRPIDSLAHFTGHSILGTWTLTIRDVFARDSGTLVAWGLDVNPAVVLQGTVVNVLTRAPVRGATVEILGTDFASRTNADGHYQFLRLDTSGVYQLRFQKIFSDSVPRYDSLHVDSFAIQLGNATLLDTAMSTLDGKYEFASTGLPVPIPDVDTTGGRDSTTPVSMTIRVRANPDVMITNLAVLVNITHTFDRDLSFWLKSPAGDSIMLVKREGEGGQNFTDCLLGDAGAALVTGTAPFTGFFRPEMSLRVLSDSSRTMAGTWAITVVDSGPGDVGTMQNFALEVTGTPILAANPRGVPRVPQTFSFSGNYPNPFNSQTEFRFDLPRRSRVELVLYNVLGRQVAQVVRGVFDAGTHVESFNTQDLASGIYFARMTSDGSATQTRKVMLLK